MSQQINLYSPIFRKEQKRFSAVTMLQASALLLGGVVIIYAFLFWQLNSLRAAVKQADAQNTLAIKRMEDISRQFSGSEVSRLETEIAVRERIAAVLKQGNFDNTRGYSEFFNALARQHVAGIWLTTFNIIGAGEKITLQGRSTKPELVPQYIQRLSREKSLAGKEFRTFQMTQPDAKQKNTGASYIEFLVATGANAAGK